MIIWLQVEDAGLDTLTITVPRVRHNGEDMKVLPGPKEFSVVKRLLWKHLLGHYYVDPPHLKLIAK